MPSNQSFYACHPQSYYRLGIPSPNFPGIARFIRGQDVNVALHVHFNGAGGNIAAGKYNDGTQSNRMVLANRLANGVREAFGNLSRSVDAWHLLIFFGARQETIATIPPRWSAERNPILWPKTQ